MQEYQLLHWMKTNLGAIGGIGGILVMLAVRFLPAYLQNLRERRLEELRQKLGEKQEYTNRERELFARIDRKDELVNQLTAVHMKSLESQLESSREFHGEALKLLRELVERMEGLVKSSARLDVDMREVKEDTSYLKGRLE